MCCNANRGFRCLLVEAAMQQAADSNGEIGDLARAIAEEWVAALQGAAAPSLRLSVIRIFACNWRTRLVAGTGRVTVFDPNACRVALRADDFGVNYGPGITFLMRNGDRARRRIGLATLEYFRAAGTYQPSIGEDTRNDRHKS